MTSREAIARVTAVIDSMERDGGFIFPLQSGYPVPTYPEAIAEFTKDLRQIIALQAIEGEQEPVAWLAPTVGDGLAVVSADSASRMETAFKVYAHPAPVGDQEGLEKTAHSLREAFVASEPGMRASFDKLDPHMQAAWIRVAEAAQPTSLRRVEGEDQGASQGNLPSPSADQAVETGLLITALERIVKQGTRTSPRTVNFGGETYLEPLAAMAENALMEFYCAGPAHPQPASSEATRIAELEAALEKVRGLAMTASGMGQPIFSGDLFAILTQANSPVPSGEGWLYTDTDGVPHTGWRALIEQAHDIRAELGLIANMQMDQAVSDAADHLDNLIDKLSAALPKPPLTGGA